MAEPEKIYTQPEFDSRLEREVREQTEALQFKYDCLSRNFRELQNSSDHKDMTIHSLATALANLSKGGR